MDIQFWLGALLSLVFLLANLWTSRVMDLIEGTKIRLRRNLEVVFILRKYRYLCYLLFALRDQALV
jgi:hypothetical protein